MKQKETKIRAKRHRNLKGKPPPKKKNNSQLGYCTVTKNKLSNTKIHLEISLGE